MIDRDGPPPRFIHSVQMGVALMHGDIRCDCAGTANPAIRRSVFSILWSPRRIAVYPTPERFSISRKKSTLSPIFRRCPRWSFLRHHLLEDVFGMIGTANEGAGEDPPDAKVAGHFAQVSELVGMVVFLNLSVLH